MATATYALFVPEHGSGALRIGYRAINNAVLDGKRRECVCGGELAVCDCGAITCTERTCDLPRGFWYCSYPGTYWEPADYEYGCTDCTSDPEDGPDPDHERDLLLEQEYEDRW